jgi:hypothetical protein
MAAAVQFYRAGNYAEAERCCRALIAYDARHVDALHMLGVLCLDQGRFDESVGHLTGSEAARPDDARIQYNLGSALLGLKQYQAAEPHLRRALALRPGDIGTLNNLGNVLAELTQHDEAIKYFRQVLAVQPDHPPAHYNLGRSLAARDELEEAVGHFRAALGDGSANPDRLADVYASLGEALVDLGRYEEALAACRAMAGARPGVASWNESLALLLLGRYAEGWRKYEGRWDVPDHDRPRADARVPRLEEVAGGKKILLTCEQGHGDIFQFARYAPLLARRGARVAVQVYVEQKALMQTLEGVETVVAREEAEPPADIVTPLLSMPLVFGTELDSIPADVPYLNAPPASVELWQQRLGPRTRPRVGVAWWGSQHIAKRSVPIEALLQVLSLPGIEFHSLQKEFPPAHRNWLVAHPVVIDHSDALDSYADTAALIALLDLVITIDTSVAHLAGALGKPVWIILPFSADWRWLLDRSDSPWYPTARLFRQKQRGEWDAVVADVARALGAWSSASVRVSTDDKGSENAR